MNIKLFGIDRQYLTLREEILEATDKIYLSGQALDGQSTKDFESAIANYTNRKYAITVNSCTQALMISVSTVVYKQYNKILVPAVSFAASANAIKLAGGVPVFCDVDPVTGLIDINKINVPLSEISGILYVNLLGNIINYDKLISDISLFSTQRITIIEDAAQSFGASYNNIKSGKLGNISCLSFDPTKNFNNYGSGGMILTDSYEVHGLASDFKNHGKNYHHQIVGSNSKMNEADCAQMLIKFKYFEKWQQRRTEIAEYYNQMFKDYVNDIQLIPTTDNVTHARSKYMIHVNDPENTSMVLKDKFNIESKVNYPYPLNTYDAFIQEPYHELSNARKFCETHLNIPIYPELTDLEVEYIAKSVINTVT